MRDEFEPILWDNVSARTALLFRMKELGAIVEMGGMQHLRFNILKELPTAEAYTDLDTITPTRGDPVTSLVYLWKQVNTPVQISGLDMIKTGDNARPQLLTLFIEAAEVAMRDAIGGSTLGIFSSLGDTTLTGISGLQNMFTTSTTTGTVGQLSRATQSNWRHQTENVSNDFSSNGLNAMRTLYRTTSRADENVDTIVFNGSTMDNYERSLTSTFQVNVPLIPTQADQRMLDAGFANYSYKGAIVFFDDGCPANFGYFLNLVKFTRLIVRSGRNAEISDFVKSRDKDDLVSFVLWAGELITTNLGRQGALLNGDTF